MSERRAPTTGQAIMFACVAAGWGVLFLVSLFAFPRDGSGWWIRVVVSGLFLVGSAVLAANLWRHRQST